MYVLVSIYFPQGHLTTYLKFELRGKIFHLTVDFKYPNFFWEQFLRKFHLYVESYTIFLLIFDASDFSNFLQELKLPSTSSPGGSADPITRSKDVRRGNKVSTGEVTRDHYLAHSFLGQVLAARYILVFLEMIAHLFALTARSYQGLFDNAGDKTCAITNLGRCLLCSRRQLHYLQGVPAQSVIFLGG